MSPKMSDLDSTDFYMSKVCQKRSFFQVPRQMSLLFSESKITIYARQVRFGTSQIGKSIAV